MAVAMEVAWRGSELGTPVLDVKKKRAWGTDAQKLMQLMMGQLHSEVKPPELTLDLLGKTDPSSSAKLDCTASESREFLELDPEEPLPSGWEKCLDLKTGKLYFVNKSSGVSSCEDPRKRNTEMELQTTQQPLAHEFLGSKKSETLRQEISLRASSSSSSGSPRHNSRHSQQQQQQLLSFATGKQLWNLQLDDRRELTFLNRSCGSPKVGAEEEEESNLELDLNLAAGGGSPSRRHEQTVCTMEMIQNALKRTGKVPVKREVPSLRQTHKHSVSSSFSSLTSIRSEPSGSHASPSTSSSSSTSSRSSSLPGARRAPLDDSRQSLKSSTTTGAYEAESVKVEIVDSGALVMGACTRCLMYVMLNKGDPRCPRCESEVPVDFSTPPSKRQRVGPNFGSDRR